MLIGTYGSLVELKFQICVVGNTSRLIAIMLQMDLIFKICNDKVTLSASPEAQSDDKVTLSASPKY